MPFLAITRRWSTAARAPARRERRCLDQIHAAWTRVRRCSASKLRSRVAELRAELSPTPRRTAEDRVAAEVHTLTAEAVRRALGKEYYDVQMLAGIVLSRGRVVEMQTGEGKTLTTLLPAVLWALVGAGVHVATTNTYLARRDFEELQPALDLLGLTSAVLPEQHDEAAKRVAYRQDVTFGTGYDFGFDFLRDQIAARRREHSRLGEAVLARLNGRLMYSAEPLQRAAACAIIDEADSVLIDEGTMPLILSGPTGEPVSRDLLANAAALAAELVDGVELDIDVAQRRVRFTDAGWRRIHAGTRQEALPLRRPWAMYVENAVRAVRLLQRDVDYVVKSGAVQIVDPQTGRIHSERSWRDGLHQAVEFREQVELTPERVSDARVTRQRYFQRYPRLAGMSGTTGGVESELRDFYGLETVAIATHRPCRREQRRTRFFVSADARDVAIVAEIVAERQLGRPVLVGTRTIRHSRCLSALLNVSGVPHAVLNGVQDQAEADIVSRAGGSGTVTIATNMAGRGTDIRLEEPARQAGGLHVIAAEHHPSRRVDRQLAGRAGRQGDPGSCRVFVSAEDEIVMRAGGRIAAHMCESIGPDGECRVDLSAALQAAQDQLEHEAFQSRRQMVARDHWLDGVLETLAATS